MKRITAYNKAIFFCLVGLIVISLTACGTKTFNLKNITEIDLTSGSDGTIIYITDVSQLEKLIQSFNDNEFLKGESAKNYTDWCYRLRFWQDDKMQAEIVVADDKTIEYNDYFYQNGNGVIDLKYFEELLDYDTNSRVAVETDLGVEMIIESVTPKGLSFSFGNTIESEYTYGGGYVLYVNNDNSWEPVQPIIENWAFTSEGYTIFPNSKTDVTPIDWTWLYGELSSGEYRFQKTILHVRSPGDFDKYVFEQDFSLNLSDYVVSNNSNEYEPPINPEDILTVPDLNFTVFLELLTTNGFEFEAPELTQTNSILSVISKLVYIGDEIITVYEYDSVAEVERDASRISPSGTSIGDDQYHPGIEISWDSKPLWVKSNLLIVLYTGGNSSIANFLLENFEHFAGYVYQ